MVHTNKERPTDCVSLRTPFGETKIPEPKNKTLIVKDRKENIVHYGVPMITPTMKQIPENKPRCCFNAIVSFDDISLDGSDSIGGSIDNRRHGLSVDGL